VLTATILGSSMAFIDGTVVNIAVPVLQSDLGATLSQAQWVVQAYSLVLAALILVGGALGDRLGRRRLFVAGIALFTAASVVCGVSANLTQLIAARVIQGIGAALLVPESLAIISASFADDRERGRAIGTWSGFTALTAATGPLIGGLLIAAGSWRYAFFLNVPVAVVALFFASRVPESRSTERLPGIDWPGALLATAGLGALVYGLTLAANNGFGHLAVTGTLAAGVVLLGLLVVVEVRGRAPMLPPSLFRSRTFTGANVFTLLLYAGLGGALFFFPFDLIQVQHYSPQAAGAAILPFVLLMFLLSRWSGGLVAQRGARLPLIVGPIVAAAGFVLFAVPGINSNYWTTFFPAVVVLGLGMAISVAPLTTTVMTSVDAHRSSLASAINNSVSRLGGVLALAVLTLLAVAVFSRDLDARLPALNLAEDIRASVTDQRFKLAAVQVPGGLDAGTASSLQRAIDESFVASFRVVMLVASGLALGASACALLTVRRRAPAPQLS
jgi:EmrB/QacA subfamily drug resistance transporter